MPKDQGIGASSKRREDVRFLTGNGQYTDDINRPRQTYAYFLRSNLAHGTINGIDTAAAAAAPGVLRVFTAADLEGLGGVPCGWQITDKNGDPMKEPKHPILAEGKVNHVGDPIAVVVAESANQARDAAELIDLDISDLGTITVNALEAGFGDWPRRKQLIADVTEAYGEQLAADRTQSEGPQGASVAARVAP
jgi:carbon-monoxide dehydrogenase large subunit